MNVQLPNCRRGEGFQHVGQELEAKILPFGSDRSHASQPWHPKEQIPKLVSIMMEIGRSRLLVQVVGKMTRIRRQKDVIKGHPAIVNQLIVWSAFKDEIYSTSLQ